jgi:hypothetical protein
LQQIEGHRTDESNGAVNTSCHLLNALETLQSIDPRALAIPDIAEKWKQALQQGWQAHKTLSSILEGWQETLSVFQRSADETFEKEEASKSSVGPRFRHGAPLKTRAFAIARRNIIPLLPENGPKPRGLFTLISLLNFVVF